MIPYLSIEKHLYLNHEILTLPNTLAFNVFLLNESLEEMHFSSVLDISITRPASR